MTALASFIEAMYGLVDSGRLGFIAEEKTKKPYVVIDEEVFLVLMNNGQPFINENRKQKMLRKVADLLGIDMGKELFVSVWMKNVRVFANFLAKAHPELGMRKIEDDEWMPFAIRRKDDIVYIGEVKGNEWKISPTPALPIERESHAE